MEISNSCPKTHHTIFFYLFIQQSYIYTAFLIVGSLGPVLMDFKLNWWSRWTHAHEQRSKILTSNSKIRGFCCYLLPLKLFERLLWNKAIFFSGTAPSRTLPSTTFIIVQASRETPTTMVVMQESLRGKLSLSCHRDKGTSSVFYKLGYQH